MSDGPVPMDLVNAGTHHARGTQSDQDGSNDMSCDDVCAIAWEGTKAGRGAGKRGPDQTEQEGGIEEKELMNGRVAKETMEERKEARKAPRAATLILTVKKTKGPMRTKARTKQVRRRSGSREWHWSWSWRRLSSESASLWYGPGRRTSASQQRYSGCYAGTSSIRGESNLKDVLRSRSRPSRLCCQGRSGVACFYVSCCRTSLSEVTKIYPPLLLCVFVDDITALLKSRNKERSRRDGEEGDEKIK